MDVKLVVRSPSVRGEEGFRNNGKVRLVLSRIDQPSKVAKIEKKIKEMLREFE